MAFRDVEHLASALGRQFGAWQLRLIAQQKEGAVQSGRCRTPSQDTPFPSWCFESSRKTASFVQ